MQSTSDLGQYFVLWNECMLDLSRTWEERVKPFMHQASQDHVTTLALSFCIPCLLFCLSGGLLVGSLDDPPRSAILSESALQYYVQQFTKSGFRYTEQMGKKCILFMCIHVIIWTTFSFLVCSF